MKMKFFIPLIFFMLIPRMSLANTPTAVFRSSRRQGSEYPIHLITRIRPATTRFAFYFLIS
jgi:hypothetical protein